MRPAFAHLLSTLALAAALGLLAACSRSASPEAETHRERAASDIAGGDAASDEAVAAYYAALVERHGRDYAACGESTRTFARECAAARDFAGGTADAPSNILLMLDASGSMAARIGGERKLDIAQDALIDFSRRLPDDARVALRVYGHTGSNTAAGKAASCAGSELLYPFQTLDRTRFDSAIRSFGPVGWTPIAASLEAAAADFADAPAGGGRNVVYLVSDGIETCDADPVAAARDLQGADIGVVVNVIGFDVSARDAEQLRAIAEAGGGEYLSASSRNDLHRLFNARSREAHARYNCASREEHGAYNATSRDQHARYNCLSRSAHAEYNAISREAHASYNAKQIDRTRRDYALAQARRKRDDILEPARRERDAVLGSARRERDDALSSERRERDDRLDEARRERDHGLQSR